MWFNGVWFDLILVDCLVEWVFIYKGVFIFKWVFVFEGVFIFEWVYVSSGSLYLKGSSFCRSSFSGSSLLILPFYTCQLFYIYRCDIFILRVPRFFIGSDNIRSCPKTSQRLPKTLRRVPSNMNTGTQRKIDFPTKKKESAESWSST